MSRGGESAYTPVLVLRLGGKSVCCAGLPDEPGCGHDLACAVVDGEAVSRLEAVDQVTVLPNVGIPGLDIKTM